MKLTNDPGQQKVVIPLIVILIGAIVITVVRVKASMTTAQQTISNAQTAASAPSEPKKTPAAEPDHIDITATEPPVKEKTASSDIPADRNPFTTPELSAVAQSSSPVSGDMPQNQALPVPKNPISVRVEPAPVKGLNAPFSPPSNANSQLPHPAASEPTKEESKIPDFKLKAILKGPKGRAAVIDSGSGAQEVVLENQILADNTRVVKITDTFVILRSPGQRKLIELPGGVHQ